MRRWAEVLADVAPERADTTAIRLWAETKSAWIFCSPRLTELVREQLQSEAPLAEILPDLIEEYLEQVPLHVPHLSANAIIYVQAFLDLMKPILGSPDMREGVEMVVDGHFPDDPRFDEYVALLHGLAVAGFEGGVPEVVTTALATGFWARLRALAMDDEGELERIDAALASAIRRSRSSVSLVEVSSPSPVRPSVLARLEQRAGDEPIWASLSRDGAMNLDEHLHGR
ncbi:hypothetical protein ACNOYE_13205 [Nannocystaceae bacterium ST9]